MWKTRLAVFTLMLAGKTLIGGGLALCLENPARVDTYTLQALQEELHFILVASDRSAAITTPCRPGIVTITLRQDPPDEETSALGGIRVRDGRLFPEIELFVSPTAQIVGTRLPGVLGRALARVATHELGHWLNQNSLHAARGCMMERLSAGYLMAPNRGFFRLPPDR